MSLFRIQNHTLPASHIREYPRATVDDQEEVLKLAIKQYTPTRTFEAREQITIIGAHANAFPKVCLVFSLGYAVLTCHFVGIV